MAADDGCGEPRKAAGEPGEAADDDGAAVAASTAAERPDVEDVRPALVAGCARLTDTLKSIGAVETAAVASIATVYGTPAGVVVVIVFVVVVVFGAVAVAVVVVGDGGARRVSVCARASVSYGLRVGGVALCTSYTVETIMRRRATAAGPVVAPSVGGAPAAAPAHTPPTKRLLTNRNGRRRFLSDPARHLPPSPPCRPPGLAVAPPTLAVHLRRRTGAGALLRFPSRPPVVRLSSEFFPSSPPARHTRRPDVYYNVARATAPNQWPPPALDVRALERHAAAATATFIRREYFAGIYVHRAYLCRRQSKRISVCRRRSDRCIAFFFLLCTYEQAARPYWPFRDPGQSDFAAPFDVLSIPSAATRITGPHRIRINYFVI